MIDEFHRNPAYLPYQGLSSDNDPSNYYSDIINVKRKKKKKKNQKCGVKKYS